MVCDVGDRDSTRVSSSLNMVLTVRIPTCHSSVALSCTASI